MATRRCSGWEMRSLTAARLVLLDADQSRRDSLARALSELGAFEVQGIATVAEACAGGSAPDLYLVEGPSLAANDEGGTISPNPFAASGIPTILMLPSPTNDHRRLALRAGYAFALAAPVSPRLLYRPGGSRSFYKMPGGQSVVSKALVRKAVLRISKSCLPTSPC